MPIPFYRPPGLTAPQPVLPVTQLVPATIHGLSGYQFNPAIRGARVQRVFPEMMYGVSAKPPVAIPQDYMARGIRTNQATSGRGGTPSIIRGRV